MPTTFAIDRDTRRRAQARAAADGISLSSAVRLLLAGYAEGRITIRALPAQDTVTVHRVEELRMDAACQKLAARIFGTARGRVSSRKCRRQELERVGFSKPT
jgi:antitoxin component of RelBE/YafQ-DinJ toxin-antitoxin module